MAKYELDGRTAIVTGAGAGIGEACARVLSSSGASVLVVDLDEERAQRVATSISKDGAPLSLTLRMRATSTTLRRW